MLQTEAESSHAKVQPAFTLPQVSPEGVSQQFAELLAKFIQGGDKHISE